jgi:uncharacterized protein YbjT (DUF2867 family)
MQCVVLGANGFIGSEITRQLLAAGHGVVGIGRNISAAQQRLPDADWRRIDIGELGTPADWTSLIDGTDAIINCAGALQDSARDNLAAVQDHAMRALYQAAKPGNPLIIQISANTSGSGADLPFMATKRAADEALRASGLRHVILRPALVIGRNAHGGTALVRALAGFPVVLPLMSAQSQFHTTAIDDVANAVLAALEGDIAPGSDLDIAHADRHSLRDIALAHRSWLGLPAAMTVAMPRWLGNLVSGFADLAGHLGWRSPLRSTAVAITAEGVSVRPANQQIGALPFQPQSMSGFLRDHPAGVQDLWFARLFLLKPMLIIGLALFWIATGVIALANPLAAHADLTAAGFSNAAATVVLRATSLTDIVLGALLLYQPTARLALLGMIGLSLAYLVVATATRPDLWLDPIGPLVKVIPAIIAMLVTLAIVDER